MMAAKQVFFLRPFFTKVTSSCLRPTSEKSLMVQRYLCNCARTAEFHGRQIQPKSFLARQRSTHRFQQIANFASRTNEKKTGPLSWTGLFLCLIAGGGVWYYVRILKMAKEQEREKERSRSIGKASLGGPFDLIDQDGQRKTDKDFLGRWILLYFGFCHCPDICPDQLDKITSIIEGLDKTSGLPKVQPIFITVDPRRDDPKSIKEYLKDFHPRFIGLSGDEPAIKAVTKAYRVYYSAGPMDDDEDYIVDHTVITYLVDPEGNFVEYFGQNKTIEETMSTIGTRMINYKHKKTD